MADVQYAEESTGGATYPMKGQSASSEAEVQRELGKLHDTLNLLAEASAKASKVFEPVLGPAVEEGDNPELSEIISSPIGHRIREIHGVARHALDNLRDLTQRARV